MIDQRKTKGVDTLTRNQLNARIIELENELQIHKKRIQKDDHRMDALLSLLTQYVLLDFSGKAKVSKQGDNIDALAAGLSVLGEEFKTTLIKLKKEEDQLSKLIQNLNVGVLLQDASSKILLNNLAASELLGLNESQLRGKTSFDKDWKVLPEDGTDFPGPEHPVPQAISSGMPVKDVVMGIYRPLCQDWVWLLVSAIPLKDGAGEVEQVICTLTNITQQKEAKKQLQKLLTEKDEAYSKLTQSKAQYNSLIQNLPLPIFTCDVFGKIIVFNEAAVKFWGVNLTIGIDHWYHLNDLINEDGHVITFDDRPIQKLLKGLERVGELEAIVKLANGDVRHVIAHPSPILDNEGKLSGVVNILTDITERKIAEKKIKASEELLSETQRITHVGSWEWDIASQNLIWSSELYRIFGMQPQEIEMTYEKFLQSIVDQDRENVVNLIEQVFKGEPEVRFQHRILIANQKQRTLSCHVRGVHDVRGALIKMAGSCIDITEAEQQKKQLRLLSLIAEETDNSVILTNRQGKIEWVNKGFTKLTRYPLNEIIGKAPYEFLHGKDTDLQVATYINAQILEGKAYHAEIKKYTKFGDPFWASIQGQPLLNNDGNIEYFFNIETDITLYKEGYEELLLMEKSTRSFANQLNQSIEKERRRIAREIHDELGQKLVSIKMSMSTMKHLCSTNLVAIEHVNKIISDADQVIKSIRKLTLGLHPSILDTLGLFDAIKWLAKEFELNSKMIVQIKIGQSDLAYDMDVAICYFRICQETLTNVAKHAEASQITVELTQRDNILQLTIKDNGRGMDMARINKFSSGILGMKERALMNGAVLNISSMPGDGTLIKLTKNINDI